MPARPAFLRSAPLLLLALAACASPSEPPLDGDPGAVQIVSGSASWRSDPATVEAAEIRGDELHVRVRYGGGCREHRFALYFDGAFMESDPVQARLRMGHDAQGDMCRALVGKELVFDLTPLKRAYQGSYAARGVITVHLHAPGPTDPAPTTLRYTF